MGLNPQPPAQQSGAQLSNRPLSMYKNSAWLQVLVDTNKETE